MYKTFFLFLLVMCFRQSVQAEDCNCKNNLDYLIKKVQENYPGFGDKVTTENRAAFEHFTDSLKKQAAAAPEERCYLIMKAWLSFFKDKHLTLIISSGGEQAAFTRNIFADEETIQLTSDFLKRYFARNPGNSIEGRWHTSDGSYEVAIMQQDKRLAGVILKADSVFWMPGQVKFELTNTGGNRYRLDYKMRDHEKETSEVIIDPAQRTLVLNSVRWTKILPPESGKTNDVATEKEEGFYFRLLNKQTGLLRLPSFDLSYKEKIDSLIGANLSTITSTPHLIIDIRGNIGGYNIAFDSVLPILYTTPVISPGTSILATEDNIKLYESMLSNKALPAKDKEEIAGIVARLKQHKNGYAIEKDDTLRLESVYKYPQKIAVIIDENCASATEHFVLKAKQSKKVVLLGMPTAGIIDYTNLIGARGFLCSHYQLYCPTAKSNRLPEYPLDNIGIPPDVRIDKTVKNWVTFADEYLKRNK